MCQSSLYKLMKQINFKHLKRNCKSILIELDDIIRWRRKYLKTIKQYRNEGRIIYYLDETWVNKGHIKQKVWTDNNIVSRRRAELLHLINLYKDKYNTYVIDEMAKKIIKLC